MMTNDKLYASDCRRAASLVCHYARGDLEGINAMLEEAVEAERVTPLLMALLNMYGYLIPILMTKLGMECLANGLVGMTRHAQDIHCRRSARMILHHGASDVNGMNAILDEAKEAKAVSELFLAVVEVYTILVPALHTDLGLKALQATVVDLAAVEDK